MGKITPTRSHQRTTPGSRLVLSDKTFKSSKKNPTADLKLFKYVIILFFFCWFIPLIPTPHENAVRKQYFPRSASDDILSELEGIDEKKVHCEKICLKKFNMNSYFVNWFVSVRQYKKFQSTLLMNPSQW